ncbi:hypothetical protein Drorol1_Dr00015470 [Drosera rotundifolia]
MLDAMVKNSCYGFGFFNECGVLESMQLGCDCWGCGSRSSRSPSPPHRPGKTPAKANHVVTMIAGESSCGGDSSNQRKRYASTEKVNEVSQKRSKTQPNKDQQLTFTQSDESNICYPHQDKEKSQRKALTANTVHSLLLRAATTLLLFSGRLRALRHLPPPDPSPEPLSPTTITALPFDHRHHHRSSPHRAVISVPSPTMGTSPTSPSSGRCLNEPGSGFPCQASRDRRPRSRGATPFLHVGEKLRCRGTGFMSGRPFAAMPGISSCEAGRAPAPTKEAGR